MTEGFIAVTGIDSLPEEVVSMVLLPLCVEYAPALRAVCRSWRAGVQKLPERLTRRKGMSFLAEKGHTNLILWVRGLRGDLMQPQLDWMFVGASGHGLLHDWGASNRYSGALREACRGGHAGVVFQLWKWTGAPRPIRTMLEDAALAGHYGLVAALWERIDDGVDAWMLPDIVLREAARGGHADIMKFALARGASLLGKAFVEAASGGQIAILEELWPQCGAHFGSQALDAAALSGQLRAAECLIKWGGARLEVGPLVLCDAAMGGNKKLLELLMTHCSPLGVYGWRNVMNSAVLGGHGPLCLYVRSLGGKVGPEEIELAARRGHADLLPQLWEWYQEDKYRGDGGAPPDEGLLRGALQQTIEYGSETDAHTEAAKALRRLGATVPSEQGVGDVFGYAAAYGSTELMCHLKQWYTEDGVALDYDEAMHGAAEGGHEDAMMLLRRWAAEVDAQIDYPRALAAAASQDQIKAMALLMRWTASSDRPFTDKDLRRAQQMASTHCRKRAFQYLGEQRALLSGALPSAKAPLDEAFDELFVELSA
jgi:hypothetical protein